MVLKSYFDGGGKDDSSQYDVVSLASVSAIASDWQAFEIDWRILLHRYFGDGKESYLHTTDAVTGNGVYKGWGFSKTFDFLSDCVEKATKHILKPKIPETGYPGEYGLYAFVISIVLKDFIEHAKSDSSLAKNANEVCLRQTLARVIPWSWQGANPPCDECHFFFDQGEDFYGHLVQLMQSKKAKKDAEGLNRITSRTEANMRRVIALQLADLLAWCHGHKLDTNKPEWHEAILRSGFDREWIDHTNITNTMPDQQRIWNSWSLPPRRPTR